MPPAQQTCSLIIRHPSDHQDQDNEREHKEWRHLPFMLKKCARSFERQRAKAQAKRERQPAKAFQNCGSIAEVGA